MRIYKRLQTLQHGVNDWGTVRAAGGHYIHAGKRYTVRSDGGLMVA
jgi:hypothetical protein